MMILAVFTESAVPKTGLSPTVDIYRLDTNAKVVDAADMTEVGTSGQYTYDFTAWDSSIDYSVVCDSVDLTGSERYAYSAISASPVVEDTLSQDDILRILLAKATGTATGGGGSIINFKSVDTAKDRIVMTVDQYGNRSSVSVDGSA
jgi:hypothetical protein